MRIGLFPIIGLALTMMPNAANADGMRTRELVRYADVQIDVITGTALLGTASGTFASFDQDSSAISGTGTLTVTGSAAFGGFGVASASGSWPPPEPAPAAPGFPPPFPPPATTPNGEAATSPN